MEIVNCTWKFQLQCPKLWGGLRETGDPKVRICESCLRNVHLCENDAEVRERAARGECVAVGFLEEGAMLLGEVIEGN